MRHRRSLPRSRSGLVTGLGGPAACVSVAAVGGSAMPSVFDSPGAQPGAWRVLRPRKPAPGTLPWWFRRFANPHDLVALKGALLVAIFLAGGLLSGG